MKGIVCVDDIDLYRQDYQLYVYDVLSYVSYHLLVIMFIVVLYLYHLCVIIVLFISLVGDDY